MNGDRILIDTNAIIYLLNGDKTIAATALYFDLPLITSDKDFVKIEELSLMLYEK